MTDQEREQARKAANEYKRLWAKRNPDKVKEAQLRYWLKRAQQRGEEEKRGEAGS